MQNMQELMEYQNRRYRTVKKGLIETPEGGLKLYQLLPDYSDFEQGIVNEAKEFIKESLDSGLVEKELGIGFVILSKDALNICRWSKEDAKVLKNDLFSFKEISDVEKLVLEEKGAFCLWELKLAGSEAGFWQDYLDSMRTEQDKRNYLSKWTTGFL